MKSALLAAVSLALAVSPAQAEDAPADSARSTFAVVEFAINRRLVELPGTDDYTTPGHWTLGILHRVDDRNAFGGAARASFDEGTNLALLARYRRTLDENFLVDVAAGAYLTGGQVRRSFFSSGSMRETRIYPAPTFEVAVSFDDWVGVQAGFDVVRRREVGWGGETEAYQAQLTPYAGVRFSGILGVAVPLLLLTAGGAIMR